MAKIEEVKTEETVLEDMLIDDVAEDVIEDSVEDEVTEEAVQAVANAIVEEAKEQDKTVEEIVTDIISEENVDEKDIIAARRGFKNYAHAVEYSESANFKKLHVLDQNEFKNWLNNIK